MDEDLDIYARIADALASYPQPWPGQTLRDAIIALAVLDLEEEERADQLGLLPPALVS